MIQRSGYIVILAVLFLLFAQILDGIGFWSIAGLPQPEGFRLQGLLFLLVLFVCQNWLFDPFLRTLDERENQTVHKRSAAQKTQTHTEEKMQAYRSAIAEAHLRALRERDQAGVGAETTARAEVQKARKEASGELAQSLSRFQNDAETSRTQLQSSLDDISEQIVNRVLTSKKNSVRHSKVSQTVGAKSR